MKNNDLIQVTFTQEEITSCNEHLDALETFTSGFAPNLTTEDRQSLGSINEINKLFVNKSQILMEQHPELVPSFVDSEEFNRDYVSRKQIEEMLLKVENIKRKLSDTKIMLDHDNYQDSLTFYRSVRYYALEQEKGAIPIYEQLKAFFPNNKNGKPVEVTEEGEK